MFGLLLALELLFSDAVATGAVEPVTANVIPASAAFCNTVRRVMVGLELDESVGTSLSFIGLSFHKH